MLLSETYDVIVEKLINYYGINLDQFDDKLYIENYKNFNNNIGTIYESIDLDEGFGAKLRPIFVILLYSDTTFDHIAEKIVKGQKYWHAALVFGPALSRTYSFNFGQANANKFKGGLSFESLKMYKDSNPTGTMEVSCILVKPEKYKQIKQVLDYYIRNKEKTKYSFINLFCSLFGIKTKNGLKMNLVCSTFVDTVLKAVDIYLNTNKSTNLTKADDLATNSSKKQFKIYNGPILKYNLEKAANIVEKLSNNIENDYFYKK